MNPANPIHKTIMEQIVMPAVSNIPRPAKALVLEYNQETNRAIIECQDQNTNTRNIYDHVPVMYINGFSRSGPFKGQEVLILFLGQHTDPIVLADVDTSFSANTRQNHQSHRRKGSWLPDLVCGRTNF